MRKVLLAACAAILLLAGCKTGTKAPALKSGLDKAAFDTTINGMAVSLYTLVNKSGMEVDLTNYGARIVSIMVPDREGVYRDVSLGFDSIKGYADTVNTPSNFGAVVGRYANRIAKGRFSIGEQTYQLPLNNHGNCLHGGFDSWYYRPWYYHGWYGGWYGGGRGHYAYRNGTENHGHIVGGGPTGSISRDGRSHSYSNGSFSGGRVARNGSFGRGTRSYGNYSGSNSSSTTTRRSSSGGGVYSNSNGNFGGSRSSSSSSSAPSRSYSSGSSGSGMSSGGGSFGGSRSGGGSVGGSRSGGGSFGGGRR